MRPLTLALCLTVASCAVPPAPIGQSVFPAELAGRVAGTPSRCLSIGPSSGLRVADSDRHMLISGSGRIVWSNSLGPSCGFGPNDLLVFEPLGNQYCRGDIVRSVDRTSGIPGPSCVLGDFVPWVRS
jgi:hypothetical protein